MEMDPHTLHLILQRIRQQMRCPQCGDKVPVEFASVRMTGNDFLLLQVRCDVCDAYIVLHASLQGVEIEYQELLKDGKNVSSVICGEDLKVEDVTDLLKEADGSFSALFKESEKEKKSEKAG